jgi:hypothetical protein
MAEIVDNNELQEGNFDQVTDQQQEQPQEPKQAVETPVEEPKQEVIPDKYKGKSLEDIVKMHQEAEKLIGRQAQEVHEVRSLADQLLKQQLEAKQQRQPEPEPEEDFFVDPKQAVSKAVDQHPAVLEAKQAALEMKKMKIAQQLQSKHPDFVDIVQNTDFHEWVKASPVRIDLFTKADAEFDFPAADELLSTYKELKQIKAAQQQQLSNAVETKAQETALRAAAVDVGGSGEVSKKIYRRADLIKLKMTDPDRYMALQDEIMAAYAENRVK